MNNFYSKNNYKEKHHEYMTNNNCIIYCHNCHHSVEFIDYRTERKLCTHCGYYVYRDDKTKFKYKMKEAMTNANRQNA